MYYCAITVGADFMVGAKPVKNKPTSAEIIQQADQVIEAEQARIHSDMQSVYEYGFYLLKTHLQRLIAEETQEKQQNLDPNKLIKLIGQYGRDSVDSGVKGYITEARAASAFALIEYVFSLTDGTKSPTIPPQANENSTKP